MRHFALPGLAQMLHQLKLEFKIVQVRESRSNLTAAASGSLESKTSLLLLLLLHYETRVIH